MPVDLCLALVSFSFIWARKGNDHGHTYETGGINDVSAHFEKLFDSDSRDISIVPPVYTQGSALGGYPDLRRFVHKT